MGGVIKEFKVCKSVHHHTIQINHQLDATIFPVYYPNVYLQLNMFRASSRPSSVAQQLQYQPLVLTSERGDSSVLVVVGYPTRPTKRKNNKREKLLHLVGDLFEL
jgi:hypothetical protein